MLPHTTASQESRPGLAAGWDLVSFHLINDPSKVTFSLSLSLSLSLTLFSPSFHLPLSLTLPISISLSLSNDSYSPPVFLPVPLPVTLSLIPLSPGNPPHNQTSLLSPTLSAYLSD